MPNKLVVSGWGKRPPDKLVRAWGKKEVEPVQKEETEEEIQKKIEEGISAEQFEKRFGVKPEVPERAVIFDIEIIKKGKGGGRIEYRYAVLPKEKIAIMPTQYRIYQMIYYLTGNEEYNPEKYRPFQVYGGMGIPEPVETLTSHVRLGASTLGEIEEYIGKPTYRSDIMTREELALQYGLTVASVVGSYAVGKLGPKLVEKIKPKLPSSVQKRLWPTEYAKRQIEQQLAWGEEKYLQPFSYETYLTTKPPLEYKYTGVPLPRNVYAGYGLIQTEPASAFTQIMARRGPSAMGGSTLPAQMYKPITPSGFTPETFRNIWVSKIVTTPKTAWLPVSYVKPSPTLEPTVSPIIREKSIVLEKPKAVQKPKATQIPKSIVTQIPKQAQITRQTSMLKQIAKEVPKQIPLPEPPKTTTTSVYFPRRYRPALLRRRKKPKRISESWFFKKHPIPTTSEVARDRMFLKEPAFRYSLGYCLLHSSWQ